MDVRVAAHLLVLDSDKRSQRGHFAPTSSYQPPVRASLRQDVHQSGPPGHWLRDIRDQVRLLLSSDNGSRLAGVPRPSVHILRARLCGQRARLQRLPRRGDHNRRALRHAQQRLDDPHEPQTANNTTNITNTKKHVICGRALRTRLLLLGSGILAVALLRQN